MMRSESIRKILRLNMGLAWIEGLFVLGQYLRTPSESDAAVLLGFSLLRLSLLLGILLTLAMIGFGFVTSVRTSWWEQQIGKSVAHAFEQTWIFWLLVSLSVFLYFFIFANDHYLGFLAGYRIRLIPILGWTALVVLQALISWLYIRDVELRVFERFHSVLFPAGVALLLIVLFAVFIGVTRIGLTPDSVYWQPVGTPILLYQVLIVWLIAAFFYGFMKKSPSTKQLDLLVALGLWIVACILWLSQPLTPAYNIFEARPPNFQMYPFGDALRYDVTANGFLIGKPIPSDFWIKPLYSLFLSLLHLIAKDDYGLLVSLQVMILATIPVFVYLLTGELSNRFAGVLAGILVIVRERNGIGLSNVIEVSHSRLLMSDILTMGFVVVLVWMFIRWVKRKDQSGTALFIIGGITALLFLMRGHPVVLFPGFLVLLLLLRFFHFRIRWVDFIALSLGFVLPIIPWFWRNYETLGKIAFQSPVSQYSSQMAGLYSMEPQLGSLPRRFQETNSAYYERMQRQVVQFVKEHPGEVARFISAHYVHNTVLSYLYLPHSFNIEGLRTYIATEKFWRGWKGNMSTSGWILLVFNLTMIALGLSVAWGELKGYAFIPLFVSVAYNVSVAVGRLSGWRFILPIDWMTLVYYSIGLMQLSVMVEFLLTGRFQAWGQREPQSLVRQRQNVHAYTPVLGWGIFFFGIGLMLTYGHKLFPQAEMQTSEQLIRIFEENANSTLPSLGTADIETFLNSDQAIILRGEALYPAFFKAKSGSLNYNWRSFEAKPYDRFIFYLLGNSSSGIVLPLESSPSVFPQGVDVIVLGCQTDTGYVQALSVVVLGDSPVTYIRDPMPALTCPLPEPQ